MKYFLHDTNAFQDDKIVALHEEFGFEGLGLFYTILEKIGYQEKPILTSSLKAQLGIGKRLEKCWSFLEKIGLISSNDGYTFNERILSYAQSYQIKNEKNRNKVKQWRDNQEDKKNVTGYVPVRNRPKVNKSEVKEINISFDDFWKLYDKKSSKELCRKKWVKLTDEERAAAMAYIPEYIKAQPIKQYRKNPENFLNNKSWEDELFPAQNFQNGKHTGISSEVGKTIEFDPI